MPELSVKQRIENISETDISETDISETDISETWCFADIRFFHNTSGRQPLAYISGYFP